MIEILESMLGITWGETSYDDLLAGGALFLGITSILLVIRIFEYFLRGR